MTLKLIIQPIPDQEILFLGNEDELKQIRDALSNECIFHADKTILNWEDQNNPKLSLSFDMGSYNLFNCSQDQTVAGCILKFLNDKESNISDRHQYLLQYWDFEASMIINNQSNYKSREKFSSLTSPVLLNAILNECEKENYLPGFEQLFLLFESSEKLRNDYLNHALYFCKPFTLAIAEVKQFIQNGENNLCVSSNENKMYSSSQLLLFGKKLTKTFEDYAPAAQVSNRA